MPAAIGAAVADYFAFNVIGATVASAAVLQAVVTVAATGALNLALSTAMARGRGGSPTVGSQLLSATIRQAAAARRLVYGEVKVGGILTYAAQSADGEYAYLCIALGEGPMQGIDPVIYLGDEKSDAAKFAGLVQVEFFDGAQITASSTLIAAGGGEWTAQDIGHGIAYLVVRYKFDRNAFPQGLLLPAVLAKGRRVFDPRTNTSAWTRNPALVALDYVRSAYGYQAADDEIDWDSFTQAANICDEVLDSKDPANTVGGVAGKVRRYTFDGVIEADVGPAASLAAIEQTMAGQVRHINGKWRAYAGAWRAPSGPVLTGDFLTAPPVYRAHPGRQQRINIARGTYREPRADWQDADYREQTLPAPVAAEGEIVQAVNFPGTTVGATAQRLARVNMLLARRRVPLVLKCNYGALLWQEMDVVAVNLPLAGISGDYVIDTYTYNADGGISMTLFPHVASDYAWDAEAHEALVPVVVKPSFKGVAQAPQNLQVSGVFVEQGEYSRPALTATWTAPDDALRKHFELQWRVTGTVYELTHYEVGAAWSTQVVAAGTAYDVRVRAVRLDDTTSPWVEVLNTTVQNDTTPPGPPTNLSVTAGSGSGGGGGPGNPDTVRWTTPTDLDILRSRVYASSTNNPATATQIGEVFGLPGTAYSLTHPHSTAGTFYWVQSVDRVGNTSARTYVGTA
jgi:hypothetical protein